MHSRNVTDDLRPDFHHRTNVPNAILCLNLDSQKPTTNQPPYLPCAGTHLGKHIASPSPG